MRHLAFGAIALLALLSPAQAKPPHFAASCPTGIVVEADRAGRAYLDGKPAVVRSKNARYSEISRGGITVSVSTGGGELDVSYTGPGRAHGVCKVTEQETVETPAKSARAKVAYDVPAGDKRACVRAMQAKGRTRMASIIEATSSEANNTVIVGLGPQRARWRCLVKRGRVGQLMSLTDEGAL